MSTRSLFWQTLLFLFMRTVLGGIWTNFTRFLFQGELGSREEAPRVVRTWKSQRALHMAVGGGFFYSRNAVFFGLRPCDVDFRL